MRLITLLIVASFAAMAQPREPARTPNVVERVEAGYTDEARAAQLQGTVTVYVEIDEQGKPDRVAMLQGLGLGLDEKAVQSVEKWRFEPVMVGGAPRRTAFGAEVQFRLKGERGWRIRQATYTVVREDLYRSEPAVKPVMAHYTAPATDACGGDDRLVRVEMNLGKDGRPSGIRIDEGKEAMGKAVEAAARSWTFRPALGSGKPRAAKASLLLECVSASPSTPLPPVVRVGEGVSPPWIVSKVEPEYSEAARKIKYQGSVKIDLEIDSAGVPTNLRIAEMLGNDLDFEAMAAVKGWRFRPGTKEGRPVPVFATLEVNFRLL